MPAVGTFELFNRGLLALPSAEQVVPSSARPPNKRGGQIARKPHNPREIGGFCGRKMWIAGRSIFRREGLALIRTQIAARSARAPNGRTARVGRKSHKIGWIDASIRGSKCSRCWNICTFRRLRDWGGIGSRSSEGRLRP